jgi:hypothetical protein
MRPDLKHCPRHLVPPIEESVYNIHPRRVYISTLKSSRASTIGELYDRAPLSDSLITFHNARALDYLCCVLKGGRDKVSPNPDTKA